MNFCENCGTPVGTDAPAPSPAPEAAPDLTVGEPAGAPAPAKKFPVPVVAVIGIALIVVIAVTGLFILPKLSGTGGPTGPVVPIVVPKTNAPITTTTVTGSLVTSTPLPASAFPNALALKEKFAFGSGDVTGEGIVYRYWMNKTYQWHNDKDNLYYVENPPDGKKFLIVFVNVVNNGKTRFWPQTAGNIHIISEGTEYPFDEDHYLPDKSVNRKATAIEIKEIQYISKLAGSEYVEDFGYSHDMELARKTLLFCTLFSALNYVFWQNSPFNRQLRLWWTPLPGKNDLQIFLVCKFSSVC